METEKRSASWVSWEDAEIPVKTSSYQPIGHQELIDLITERLSLSGYTVISKKVNQNGSGTRMVCEMVLQSDEDPDMTMMLAVMNSYDKSRAIKIASGARVWACENGMIVGDLVVMRKHTSELLRDLTEMIDGVVINLREVWEKTVRDMELMKQVPMTDEQTAELYGRLYIIEAVVTSVELNKAVKELKKPSFLGFVPKNLWSSYNHITWSLKNAPPHRKLDCLKRLHDVCMDIANDASAITPYE